MDRLAIFGAGMFGIFIRIVGWLFGVAVYVLIGWLSDSAYASSLWPVGALLRIVNLFVIGGLLLGALALLYQIVVVLYASARGIHR